MIDRSDHRSITLILYTDIRACSYLIEANVWIYKSTSLKKDGQLKNASITLRGTTHHRSILFIPWTRIKRTGPPHQLTTIYQAVAYLQVHALQGTLYMYGDLHRSLPIEPTIDKFDVSRYRIKTTIISMV